MNLNVLLILSTLQFFCEDLTGHSLTVIPCPDNYLTKNCWQNSGSALKYDGVPWRKIHTSSNFAIITLAHCDSTRTSSTYPVCMSTMFSASYFVLLYLVVMKSAWTSLLKSFLKCFREIFLARAGVSLDTQVIHDVVTFFSQFLDIWGEDSSFFEQIINLIWISTSESVYFFTIFSAGRFFIIWH